MADLGADIEAAHDLLAFIDESPTPFHACASAAARLDAAGFTRSDESGEWPKGRTSVTTSSATAASSRGPCPRRPAPPRRFASSARTPTARTCGSSRTPTSSAPARTCSRSRSTAARCSTRGSTATSASSGRVALRGGSARARSQIDRPIARVPQLAIHLDREVNTQGSRAQPAAAPGPGVGHRSAEPDGVPPASSPCELGVDRDDVLFWDVMFHDVAAGHVDRTRRRAHLARRGSTTSCSCWAAVARDLVDAPAANATRSRSIVLFDHEEIGSTSNRGAASSLLDTMLERITRRARWRPRRLAPRARRVDLPVGGHGARDASRTTPSATSPGTGSRSTAARWSRRTCRSATPPTRDRPRCSSRRAIAPVCRCSTTSTATICRAGRRSDRSPPPASASPRSTSARRNCRCTPPAS